MNMVPLEARRPSAPLKLECVRNKTWILYIVVLNMWVVTPSGSLRPPENADIYNE